MFIVNLGFVEDVKITAKIPFEESTEGMTEEKILPGVEKN